MNTRDPSDSLRPTPPKSAERIRATLESVRKNRGPSAPAGPQAGGLKADDAVVVASFYDAAVGRKFQERLTQAGLMSNGAQVQGLYQVSVDAEDRGPAAALLAEVRAKFPDRPQTVRGLIFDYVFFFAAIGATLSFVGVSGTLRQRDELFRLKSFLIVGGFTAYGAVIGGLFADLRCRLFRGGRLRQFGIRELMFLIAIVALTLGLRHYLRWLF